MTTYTGKHMYDSALSEFVKICMGFAAFWTLIGQRKNK